jgi:RNA polymerase sigma-B factor
MEPVSVHSRGAHVGAARRRSEQRRREDLLLRRYAETRSTVLRERLIKSFMPLARSLAMRYRGGSEPLEDLVGVANVGLVKAIDGFDPARRRPFTAYAVPTILGELRRHFRDHVWSLHLPRGLGELAQAIDDASSRLTRQLGRSPAVAEVAALLEVDEESVLEAMNAAEARKMLSLDVPSVRGEDESAPAVDSVRSVELGYDAVEARLAAREADLDEREWRVLRLKFVDGLTQYEIAERLGVSQMQISRVMRKALGKLLAAVRGRELEPV